MKEPLTIRLDSTAYASRDDGATARLSGTLTAQLRGLVERDDLKWEYGAPTASLLGTLAEAKEARPLPAELAGAERPPTRRLAGPGIPVGSRSGRGSEGFAALLERRRSERDLHGPVAFDDLAALLLLSGRVRLWGDAEDGFQWTTRPAPSAGGRHPCELWVASWDVEGLQAGLWSFEPATCQLHLVASGDAGVSYRDAIATVGRFRTVPAAVFVVADFGRTLARYPAGASLAWRDAGALLTVLHLVATDLRMPSCIVGVVGLLQGLSQLGSSVDVGALAIGASSKAEAVSGP